jgi:hypothetical protein
MRSISIVRVVIRFVCGETAGVVPTSGVGARFFLSSAAVLATDQNNINEAIAARQAPGFIGKPFDPFGNTQSEGKIVAFAPSLARNAQEQILCHKSLVIFYNHLG